MKPEDRLRELQDPARWDDDGRWRPVTGPENGHPMRTRSRTWLPLLGAAAAIVGIAGASAAGYAHWAGSRSDAPSPSAQDDSVIAWQPLPPSDTKTAEPPATCDAATLKLSSNQPDIVMGAYHLKIAVTNNGPTCSLPAKDVVLGARIDGQGKDLATSQTARADDVPIVEAGATIDYYAAFDPSCTEAASIQEPTNDVLVSVADVEAAVTGTSLPDALATCSSASFTAPPTAAQDVDPYPDLTASISLPETATGDVLNYSVTLTNHGQQPFKFDDCPTYTQSAAVYEQGTERSSYTLNCQALTTPIDPGQSASFDMQTPLPSAAGTLKVGWFIAAGGPSATGSLELK